MLTANGEFNEPPPVLDPVVEAVVVPPVVDPVVVPPLVEPVVKPPEVKPPEVVVPTLLDELLEVDFFFSWQAVTLNNKLRVKIPLK